MNLIVCMKQTFDTEEKIVLEGLRVSEENVQFVINPYDEFAIEEAIRLREEHGGEVTVITVGPDRVEKALRTALAMGADKAIHIYDECLSGDEFVLSKVLTEVIRPLEYDMILAGNFAIDSGSGQVAIRLAEHLDLLHIGSVTHLHIEGDQIVTKRDVEGETEGIRASLPVLITTQQGLNEPRYPSLQGIMKAKKKPLERLMISDINLDKAWVSQTSVIDVFLPLKKEQGRVLKGSMKEQAEELVSLLRYEVKVV
ncbi:MAG: electron transfer flavoprotein subunit beta/FixA family protein [Paenibacillaceae bacterium]